MVKQFWKLFWLNVCLGRINETQSGIIVMEGGREDMSLGSRLRERRQQLGLTLEEVAQAVGVSKSTVQKWESGTIEDMRLAKAAGLAKALKVSPLSRRHGGTKARAPSWKWH